MRLNVNATVAVYAPRLQQQPEQHQYKEHVIVLVSAAGSTNVTATVSTPVSTISSSISSSSSHSSSNNDSSSGSSSSSSKNSLSVVAVV